MMCLFCAECMLDLMFDKDIGFMIISNQTNIKSVQIVLYKNLEESVMLISTQLITMTKVKDL